MPRKSATDNAAIEAATIDTAETSASADALAELVTELVATLPDETPAPAEETPAPEVPTAVEAAQANVNEIEAALAVATRPTIVAALNAELETALGELALAESEDARQAEKALALDEAAAAAAVIADPMRRAARLALMVAAIESEYAPIADAPAADETPAVETAPIAGRRPLSDRQIAANAAIAADPTALARGGAFYVAWDADAAKLACSVGRAANTRFPSLVPLAPSGAGVANGADYENAVRSVRAYMLATGWPTKPADGAGVAESKWLAARGRFAAGGKASARQECFKFSGAEIALYPDGRFRLAYPATAGVRFLRTDDAAWRAFVGETAGATVAAAPTSAPLSAGTPTPPNLAATPGTGALARTAQCQHCGAKNIVGHAAACRNCAAADWLAQA